VSTAVATLALPAAWLVIWALLRSPVARRLVAVPSADRWHADSTPSFGGIGIFAGFTVGFWAAVAVGAFPLDEQFLGVFGAVTLVFAAGLTDDLYGLPPLVKLGAQIAAAAIVISTGTHIQLVHNPIIGDAIALLWLTGVANAFNLLDNMDGLAATLAAIAFAFFAVDALTVHPDDTSLAFALAGGLACVGFLPFNLRRGPALVFMGDSGSQMLGFALASLGLVSSWRVAGTTVATLVLPILVLAIPILDTTLVTVARLLDGRPIHQGGRDHSSHRLVRYGLSERKTVLLLALIAFCIGGSSLAYNVFDNFRFTILGVLVTFVLLVQFASFLADLDRRPIQLGEPLGFGDAFAVHWRRLIEVLVDFFVITASFLAAYVIEFGWPGTDSQRFIRDLALPVILACRYLAFIPFGLYRSVWRFAGIRDAISAACAVIVSEVAALAFMVLTQDMRDFRLSFFIVDALICMIAIAGSRFAERMFLIGKSSIRDHTARRSLIVGAGRTGRSLMRELRETGGERVVGFVDDNPHLRRRSVHGIKILGGTSELQRIIARTQPDIVLVTIPDAPRETLDALVATCNEAEVSCRFVRRELDLDPRVVFGAASE
jgi:UDP-GlcNAc:undecaprenyl-phosphate/decaprenyl-phosphate GlcNAc-1-phosphate transferase